MRWWRGSWAATAGPTGAVDVTGAVNEAAAESIGWPELVDQVAAVVRALPAEEQDDVEPSDPGATVVSLRYSLPALRRHSVDCEQVATIDNLHDVDNEIQDQPITVCRGLRAPWPDIWDDLRRFS